MIILSYGLLCWFCWYRYHRSQIGNTSRAEKEAQDLLIAFASQTGRAAELARATAEQLNRGRIATRVLPLDRVDDRLLRQSKNILFVVSTYGEGGPPDTGARFAHRYLRRHDRDLSHLRYAVLALGDRQYQHFCGFGHQLCQGLRGQAAQPLFDLVEVDGQDPQALALWQQRVIALGGAVTEPASLTPAFVPANLEQRACINVGSAGAPTYRIFLKPNQPMDWQAGDIVSIYPGNDSEEVRQFIRDLDLESDEYQSSGRQRVLLEETLCYRRLPRSNKERQSLVGLPYDELLKQLPPLPSRDYSIASIPEEGGIELLVRQMRQADGRLGIGSGWLTQHAPLNSSLRVHVRSNPAFHATHPQRPLILIGSGTGMAGLRVHLRAREKIAAHRNWLLFGERNAAYDLYFGEDIDAWYAQGHLQRLDLAFSRDGGGHRYVQDLLVASASELRSWVAEGAAIYVCGNRQGMAAGVESALKQILTDSGLKQLQEQNRYCRDVY